MYRILKPFIRLAMLIFCRKIIINRPDYLKEKGPLLLACNHPNSFLDAVIINALMDQQVWSLARGDVFKKPFYKKILTALNILPVYRTSEGVENLGINYETFEECKKIFYKKGIVLIFSEGKCINEWHLRSLKKGTARLAVGAWEENIPLRVLPVGINYSSFRRFGKNIFLNFGIPFTLNDIEWNAPDGIRHQSFNLKLRDQFQQLVYEIEKKDKPKQRELLKVHISSFKKILLFFPAIAGGLLHAPLYIPIRRFVYRRTNNNDHFDSIVTAMLLFIYPVTLLLATILTFFFFKSYWVFLLLLILPFTAWSFVQLKEQLDR
ncbi:MAG: 1-acyl-sn-glycerol-3-phosphate acyltransferase [Bacteroidetes bacterium]|nr:1-acyl-sn-glycerol-3-phosphate acyltransferase [Bacteroidota bacterium]